MSSSIPPISNPDQPPTPGPERRWLIPGAIGVLAGLVVGVLVGSFLLGGRSNAGTAAGDADVVCDYVSHLSAEYDPEGDVDFDDPLVWQLQAIGPLAVAAGKADSRYQELGDLGEELYSAVSRLDAEALEQALADMSEACQSI